jgi:hypothetical protein
MIFGSVEARARSVPDGPEGGRLLMKWIGAERNRHAFAVGLVKGGRDVHDF